MNKIFTLLTYVINTNKGLLCVLLVFVTVSVFSQRSWLLDGNSLNTTTDFLGTTDYMPIIFKTDDVERARFTETGYFGIGIDVPKHTFHVHDNRLITLTETDDQVIQVPILHLPKNNINYAFSAFQLTNNSTGITESDGLLIYTKDNNAGISLQEQGTLDIVSGSSILTLHPDKKISFFNPNMSSANVNIFSLNNNALDMRVLRTGNTQLNYAINIESNTNAIDFMRASSLNKMVYRLNGKGEAYFGHGIERVSLGNTNGLGNKYATGYIGFNITRENNFWISKGDNANNGAVLIYSNIAGELRIANIKTSGGGNAQLTDSQIDGKTSVFINRDGQVGIGTEELGPNYKLAVEGTIGARRVRVTEVSFWADYVFCPTYKLKPLSEVEEFVRTHRHLPDVPTEAQVKEEGLDVAEMNAILLQKIEELYLYVIELEKQVHELSK